MKEGAHKQDHGWWRPGRDGWWALACPSEAVAAFNAIGNPIGPVGFEFRISWSCKDLKHVVWQLFDKHGRPVYDWPPPNDQDLNGGVDC